MIISVFRNFCQMRFESVFCVEVFIAFVIHTRLVHGDARSIKNSSKDSTIKVAPWKKELMIKNYGILIHGIKYPKLNSDQLNKGKIHHNRKSGMQYRKAKLSRNGVIGFRERKTKAGKHNVSKYYTSTSNSSTNIVSQNNVTNETEKSRRTMVYGNAGAGARKRAHISPVLLSAIKLLLDERNHFKKGTNALELANALQNKDSKAVTRSNLIPLVMKPGLTQNGYRARMIRVKDAGYTPTVSREQQRRTTKAGENSRLVDPTKLGISILKLLFGKQAALVTRPKYRDLLNVRKGRLDAKLLAGYGSPRQREQQQQNIERENSMIVLKGIREDNFYNALAKSVSDLIKAMSKEDKKEDSGNTLNEKEGHKHHRNITWPKHHTEDLKGTRKSWVLLKIPKNEAQQYSEDNPKHESLGKHHNLLSEVKLFQHPKPSAPVSENTESKTVVGGKTQYTFSSGGEGKKASEDLESILDSPHVDTDSRDVPPQVISETKEKLEENSKSKLAEESTTPGTMAFSLSKILKAIEESIQELKTQQKETLASKPVIDAHSSSPLAAMTVPEMGPPKSDLAFPKPQSSEASAVPELLSAIKKLLGSNELQHESTSKTSFARIPSDEANAEDSLRPSPGEVAMGTRRFTEESDPQNRQLNLRPAGYVREEPITRTSHRMQPSDNVLFESDDDIGTPRDTQATVDAIKLKEDLEAFAEKGLQAHNRYRADHHAPALKWSDELATQAEKLAYNMAMKGTIERSEVAAKLGYGENVAKITGTNFNKAGEEATSLWYAEGQNYSFSDPRLSPKTDAFTQVVWKSSKKLGMGCARDLQTNDLYVVALYDPMGNDPMVLRANVLNTGGVTQDVYASIFKRFRMDPKIFQPTGGSTGKTIEHRRTMT